jgi:hypothetical protein
LQLHTSNPAGRRRIGGGFSPQGQELQRRAGLVTALACVLAVVISAGARAEAGCANDAFRTGLSANLPECRAYEQVSPPFKDGARIEEIKAVTSDGQRVIVNALGDFGDAANSGDNATAFTYELTRTQTGWGEASLDPPASGFPWEHYLDASADFGETLWNVRTTSQSLRAHDLYVRDGDGALHDLGPTSPPSETAGRAGVGEPESILDHFIYRGASADLSYVLFSIATPAEAPSILWPGDTTGLGALEPHAFASLYEHTGNGVSEPKLVGVKNNGPLASNTEAELISNCETVLGSGEGGGGLGGGRDTYNAVSESGSTVFFTAVHAGQCAGVAQPALNELYARINGSKTVAISEPILPPGEECTGKCKAASLSEGVFQGASRDGSKVFFLTEQPLLNSDEDTTTDLYEAEIEGEGASAHVSRLVQVSHDPNLGQAAEVQGVVRVSEDGSHVYFVAKGVLASNSNGQAAPSSTARLGAENLYVYEPDPENPGRHTTAFVGMLCSDAGFSGAVGDPECNSSDSALWSREDSRPAQATPDGRFLVFSSATDLSAPEDTSTVNQIFRYDAQTGELARVSIGQNGFNANGNTNTFGAEIRTEGFAGDSGAARMPGTISEDGSYVVFRSADGLTPQALNGHTTTPASGFAKNVYEYHEGDVSLISDGQDATSTLEESSVRLEGITGSGGDIFFQTVDPLVPQDTDTARDLYDARIGGGFPPLPPFTSCQDAICQGEASSPPSLPVATSATGEAGNLAPPVSKPAVAKPKPKHVKCKRNFVKKHNKCVKKSSKTKKAKKSSRDRSARR